MFSSALLLALALLPARPLAPQPTSPRSVAPRSALRDQEPFLPPLSPRAAQTAKRIRDERIAAIAAAQAEAECERVLQELRQAREEQARERARRALQIGRNFYAWAGSVGRAVHNSTDSIIKAAGPLSNSTSKSLSSGLEKGKKVAAAATPVALSAGTFLAENLDRGRQAMAAAGQEMLERAREAQKREAKLAAEARHAAAETHLAELRAEDQTGRESGGSWNGAAAQPARPGAQARSVAAPPPSYAMDYRQVGGRKPAVPPPPTTDGNDVWAGVNYGLNSHGTWRDGRRYDGGNGGLRAPQSGHQMLGGWPQTNDGSATLPNIHAAPRKQDSLAGAPTARSSSGYSQGWMAPSPAVASRTESWAQTYDATQQNEWPFNRGEATRPSSWSRPWNAAERNGWVSSQEYSTEVEAWLPSQATLQRPAKQAVAAGVASWSQTQGSTQLAAQPASQVVASGVATWPQTHDAPPQTVQPAEKFTSAGPRTTWSQTQDARPRNGRPAQWGVGTAAQTRPPLRDAAKRHGWTNDLVSASFPSQQDDSGRRGATVSHGAAVRPQMFSHPRNESPASSSVEIGAQAWPRSQGVQRMTWPSSSADSTVSPAWSQTQAPAPQKRWPESQMDTAELESLPLSQDFTQLEGWSDSQIVNIFAQTQTIGPRRELKRGSQVEPPYSTADPAALPQNSARQLRWPEDYHFLPDGRILPIVPP